MVAESSKTTPTSAKRRSPLFLALDNAMQWQ
jgi:hypothetical protein